jgi:hypothetical protein
MVNLQNYVINDMRMNAIYQPVIIGLLAANNGKCSLEVIANTISLRLHGNTDRAKYYEGKLKLHPKKVLTKNGVATIVPKSGVFTLLDDVKVTNKKEIINICNAKIKAYLEAKQ